MISFFASSHCKGLWLTLLDPWSIHAIGLLWNAVCKGKATVLWLTNVLMSFIIYTCSNQLQCQSLWNDIPENCCYQWKLCLLNFCEDAKFSILLFVSLHHRKPQAGKTKCAKHTDNALQVCISGREFADLWNSKQFIYSRLNCIVGGGIQWYCTVQYMLTGDGDEEHIALTRTHRKWPATAKD